MKQSASTLSNIFNTTRETKTRQQDLAALGHWRQGKERGHRLWKIEYNDKLKLTSNIIILKNNSTRMKRRK